MTKPSSATSTSEWLASLGAYLSALADSHGHAEAVQALAEHCVALIPGHGGELWHSALEGEGWLLSARWSADGKISYTPAQARVQTLPPQGGQQLCLALTAQGLALGELRIDGAEALDGDQRALLSALASAAAVGLAGHTLQRRVRQRNVRDPLTGLFNSRYLEDTLERELHRAQRIAASLVLVRLELDHFSGIGERHGLDTAERLLQAMADWIQRSFRGSDVCCRFSEGGFALLLPEAPLDSGLSRAEGVREELSELRVRRRGAPLEPASVSAGVAAYPDHGSNRDTLLEAAESAVARARDQGGGTTLAAEFTGPLSTHP